jgi:uncharacterized protein YndB with AHSA1/START domain
MKERKAADRAIRQRVAIPAPPEHVYEALVRAKTHAAFTQAVATGTATVGRNSTGRH